ncbi:MAG: ABC transporter ATP-binding protein [Proteobacteria bacterium]|nr:ABC transporter ATP-binding protein [Pseudomonadota bacterium]MBI3496449.1 ABC transporter ATP-binding protein [Pseudomonadota bacterium]
MTGMLIEGLTKRYGGATPEMAAVSGLSLDIGPQQFITLLGPSGCGKSTTLRLIAGYLRPDAGTIAVGGRLLSAPERVVPPEERGMGMVFQNYAVWPHKTVFENVVFGLRVHKVAKREAADRVAKILDLVHLSGLEDRFPGELSGGQQQRVALARSLVVEPAILLLDEPLSNLDAKLRERMRSELKSLQRRTGIIFVYVTHDQAEALALSDRIAVMHQGRLQQFGTPREVYERPANPVVADFMGVVNLLPGTVQARDAAGGLVAAGPFRLRASLPPGLGPGDAVDIAIRPERIRFAVAADAEDAVAAEVEELSYLGSQSEYTLVLANGTRLRAQAPAAIDHGVGATVRIIIEDGGCTVFPREVAEEPRGQ